MEQVEQYSYAAQRNVTSNAFTFAYDPPRIDDLYPLVVPQLGGVVSLTGSSFGSQGAVYLDTAVTGEYVGWHVVGLRVGLIQRLALPAAWILPWSSNASAVGLC